MLLGFCQLKSESSRANLVLEIGQSYLYLILKTGTIAILENFVQDLKVYAVMLHKVKQVRNDQCHRFPPEDIVLRI